MMECGYGASRPCVCPFVTAACDGVFMSKAPDRPATLEVLGLLVPKISCFARWIDDLSFSQLCGKQGLILCWPLSCSILGKKSIGHPFTSKIRFSVMLGYEEGDMLGEKRMHKRRLEADGLFAYLDGWNPSVAAFYRTF